MILSPKTLVAAYCQALADHYLVATWVLAEACPSFPKHLSGSTRLNIGLNTPVPIPDLCVDEEGISCTLSFNRVPHFVVMPWAAVQGFMSSEEADRQIAEDKRNSQKSAERAKEDKRVVARDGNVLNVRFGK